MVSADNDGIMPVITCFYCSSYATEEMPLAINGDEVQLRLCRRHAKSHTRPKSPEKTSRVQTIVPAKPKARSFRLLRSRLGSVD
jgi:hypothetical protein